MRFEPRLITTLLMEPIHLGALLFMVVVYVLRVRRLLGLTPSAERTRPKGSHALGIAYSYGILLMPWELDGYRKHPIRFVEFAFLHVGVAAAIGLTYALPLAPALVKDALPTAGFQIACALAALAGFTRLIRRIARPAMRVISSIDDYFSLLLLDAWLIAGVFAIPMRSESAVIVFYALAALLHVYVPFSKIAHYVFWPFNRYYLGKHLGHRGVYPQRLCPVCLAREMAT